jgi:tetratricopeptide repeat protein
MIEADFGVAAAEPQAAADFLVQFPELVADLVLGAAGDLPADAGAGGAAAQADGADEATVGPDHRSVATWCSGLGSMLQDLGDLPGARDQCERALTIGEAALGPDHPAVANWRNTLGGVLYDLRDLSGAKDQYERALAVREAALGPDHPTVRTLRSRLEYVIARQRGT